MKRIIVCALALAMMLAAASCGKTSETSAGTGDSGKTSETTDTTQMQLQLIADNAATWLSTDDTETYSYAVTDLDQNGRLEIISSSCQGTGIYTYSSIWEVSEELDKLDEIENPVQEGDSQADIIVSSTPVYFDEAAGTYHYLFGDVIRNGAAENYENMVAVTLSGGKLAAECIASRSETWDKNGKTVVAYTDAQGEEIDSDAYISIGDTVFKDMKKEKASFGWVEDDGGKTLAAMDGTKLFDTLQKSYGDFSVK